MGTATMMPAPLTHALASTVLAAMAVALAAAEALPPPPGENNSDDTRANMYTPTEFTAPSHSPSYSSAICRNG